MHGQIPRRQFLRASSLIALSPAVPAFLARTARAEADADHGRILVVIQLNGGNDGINTVVPYRDEGYARHRKVLRLPEKQLLKVTDDVALHPAMRAAADLIEDGRLAVVQAAGYPHPNRSHEVSMNIWQTARTASPEAETFGWIGRATDELAAPADRSPSSVLLGTESPPHALRGRKSASIAMAHLHDLQRSGNAGGTAAAGRPAEGDGLRSFVQRTQLDAYAAADLLKGASARRSSAKYPSFQLANRLRMVAQLIKSGFKTPVYYVIQGGYDTHFLQLPDHARLLNQLSSGIKAFLDDLRAAKVDDRVVVMCFSEFGRRVAENASQGTDHGTAGPVLLAGPRVKSGVIGRTPSLTELVDGDLAMGIDFRQVYAALLGRWLGVKPAAVLGDEFAPADVLS